MAGAAGHGVGNDRGNRQADAHPAVDLLEEAPNPDGFRLRCGESLGGAKRGGHSILTGLMDGGEYKRSEGRGGAYQSLSPPAVDLGRLPSWVDSC